jgi:hypothetical protein
MQKLGGPQYLPPGQSVPGAQFSYRPSPRSAAAGSLYADQQDPSIAGGALSGGSTGLQMGMAGGPIGTAIGAAAGTAGGAIGAGLQKDQDPDSWQYGLGEFLQGRGPVADVVRSQLSRFGPKKEQ